MVTAMKMSRILSAGAIAVVAGTAVVAGAAGTAQARVACPTGYLCFQETANGGRVVRIAEGQTAHFAGGIPVYAATNSTRLTYCVASEPYDYSLAPGQEVARSHTVFRAAPGTGC